LDCFPQRSRCNDVFITEEEIEKRFEDSEALEVVLKFNSTNIIALARQ
jgi:hypothetical protein